MSKSKGIIVLYVGGGIMDARIIELHYKEVFQYTYFLVGKRELAEDLTQDTFVKALKSKTEIGSAQMQRAWLYKIARNTVYDAMKRAKLIKFISFGQKEYVANEFYEPEAWITKDEQDYELYKALGQLPFDYRQAILLRKIEGYSIKETAQILDWNESKVKNATERGMKKLEQLLGGMGHE